jgi:nitrogen fixation NifU-like protein
MNDPLYREIIMEHWKYPRNYGVIKKADIDVTENNPVCGDNVRIMAKIKNKRIEEIGFTCSGCAVSKALASILTVKVKGMKVTEFRKMKPEILLSDLGVEFSPVRMKCALLGYSTLKKALSPGGE